jgi:hypothetical protein
MSSPATTDACIPLRDIMVTMISRIAEIAETLQQDQVDCFLSALHNADDILSLVRVAGFVAKAFAMR